MNYWLVKSEPEEYSWEQFCTEGSTLWTGVRNYQARNFLLQMKPNDKVLFYHSGKAKEIVGIAAVAKSAENESSHDNKKWVAVTLQPAEKLKKTVSLSQLKKEALFENHFLLKQPRLSVMPLDINQFEKIIELSKK